MKTKKLPVRVPRQLVVIGFCLFIALAAGLVLLANKFSAVDAAWWDDSYGYRKAITVTVPSNSSDVKDLETLLTIDTTGITANLQTNCQDLRFTDVNGNTLPYYLDSCTDNSVSNKVWVLVNTVPKNTTTFTVYMYYGNPSAQSASDPNAFFRFRGLVGYWTMNETSWDGTSGEVKDSSVNGNNGTSSGNGLTTTSSGKYSYAGNFDGSIGVPKSVSIPSNAGVTAYPFTLSAWVNNTTNSDNDAALSIYTGNNTYYAIGVDTVGNPFMVARNTTTFLSSGTTSVASSWHLLTAVFSSSTDRTLFVDGIQVASDNNSVTMTASATTIGIGRLRGQSDNIFVGIIDDARIYNRALSAFEIQQLYTSPGTIATNLTTNSQPTTSFGSEEKGPGPIAYWQFDEGTGTTAKDSSSNGNSGALTNMSTTAATNSGWIAPDLCVSSNCLGFDGINDYVLGGNDGSLNILSALTLSSWIKPSEFNTLRTVLVKGSWNSNGYSYGILTTAAGLIEYRWRITSSTENIIDTTVAVPLNQWSHIEVVHTSGTMPTIYINGKPVGTTLVSGSGSNALVTSANPLTIGAGSAATVMWKGFIDEPKIYNYARSEAQIKTDYNAKASAVAKGASAVLGTQSNDPLNNGLVGYWKLDEATWSGTINEVLDSSGRGNNGQAQGNTGHKAFPGPGKFGNGGIFNRVGSNYVSFASGVSTPNAFTVATWFNKTSNISQFWIGSGNSTNPKIGFSAANLLSVRTLTASAALSADIGYTTSMNGTWNHLVVVRDVNNEVYAYLNGRGPYSMGNQTGNPSYARIGTDDSSNSNYWTGSLDETRIYDRAFSPSEVQQLYNFAPGPVGYWNFDAGQGSNVVDTSGYANNGTWSGQQPYWTNGKFGKAGKFNGVDGYVNVGDMAQSESVGQLTLGFWVKFDSSGVNQRIMSKWTGWTIRRTNGDQFIFDVAGPESSDTYFTSTSSFSDINEWHYITAVFDGPGRVLRVYRDGILLAGSTTGTVPSLISNTSANVTLGSFNGEYLKGQLDDVKIYNYVRTPDQIKEDMLGRSSPIGGSLDSTGKSTVGYWDFDQGTGTVASDRSGNGYNGTLSNMASPATPVSGWNPNGRVQKALSFDGSNDYVSLPSGVNSAIGGSSSLSISAWALANSTGGFSTIFGSGTTYTIQIYTTTNGSLRCYARTSVGTAEAIAASGFTYGTWHHVTMVYDGSQISCYVDGRLGAVKSHTGTLVTPTSTFIGWTPSAVTSETWRGMIDEVKIYNYALSPSEVMTEYNQGAALVLGAISDTSQLSGGSVASNSAAAVYCVPGDTASCAPALYEWNLNEKSGTSAFDTSGSGCTGTLISSPTWVSGKFGGALYFNGTNRVNVCGSLTGGSTLEAWVNFPAIGSNMAILGKGGNSGNKGWELRINPTGTVYYSIAASDNSAYANSGNSAVLTTNQWHHIVGVYNPSTAVQIYVDGVLANQNTTSIPAAQRNSGNPAYMGLGQNDASPFTGKIDQVRIFDYARTPAQVAWDYNQGKPIAQWDFDECQGSVANDTSGNNLLGTITIGSSGTQSSVGTCTSSNTATAWWNGRSGKYNGSLNFDGTDDYVAMGDSSVLQPSTVSVSSWFKTTNPSGMMLLRKRTGGYGIEIGQYAVGNAAGKVTFWIYNGSAFFGAVSDSTYNDGNWHHVLGSFDGATVKLYIDGQLVKTAAAVTSISYGSGGVAVGRDGDLSAAYYNGQADDVRIYNYPLTATQVKLLYNQSAGVRFGPVTGSP